MVRNETGAKPPTMGCLVSTLKSRGLRAGTGSAERLSMVCCMKTKAINSNRSAFTFIEMIIVVTVVGLLVAIVVPNMIRARDNTRLSYIYSNLRTVEGAKTQWALDNNKLTGAS